MAKLRLTNLRLKNFKGFKFFELNPNGKDLTIFGDNSTGKTTLKDGWLWLLFGKDSQNRADFEIKTIDPKTGQVIHGLEHEVEGILKIDDKELILRKSYREKWTRKRGSAEKVFTGHTTDYFIDKVPTKASEYESRIGKIAGSEATFRLLTDPGYFNEVLHWEERRKILLKVCGDVKDGDVISSNEDLAPLEKVIADRDLEDHRLIVDARRREINKELERIPIRIDECFQGLPDISEIEADKIASEISTLKEKKQAKEEERARLEAGGEIAEKTKKLREIESELLSIEIKHREKNEESTAKAKASLRKLDDEISDISSSITAKQHAFDLNSGFIKDSELALESFREKWHEVDSINFELKQAKVCPTCDRPLPKERLEQARVKASADFNQDKATRLESITASGKEKKEERNQLQNTNSIIEAEIEALQKEGKVLFPRAGALQKEIDFIQQKFTDSSDPDYTAKYKVKEETESAILLLREGNKSALIKIKVEIETIENDIGLLEHHLSQVEVYNNGQVRILELKAQEKELAAEYEKLEKEVYLLDQFTYTKVNMLESKISSKFRLARFKLFNVLINGGVEKMCETIYEGVPYSSLNNGARKNLGLDIINTLSVFYDLAAPIWFDNREAVTKLIATKGQLISLVVSQKDQKLRVEQEGGEIETKRKLEN